MLQFTGIRHTWGERAPFHLERPRGLTEYTFMHFNNCVRILVNGEMVHTDPHACILYAPHTPQLYECDCPLLHDWFHFVTDEPLPTCFSPDTLYYPANPEFVTAIVREMEHEALMKPQNYEQILGLKLHELLIKASRSLDTTAYVSESTAEQLRQIRSRMFWAIDKKWTVDQLASQAHMSPSRFYTIYRSLYGKSPMEDLICTRIDAAKSYLRSGNEPLAKIAERLGYNNMCHFTRQFRERVGVPPSVYREKHANSQRKSLAEYNEAEAANETALSALQSIVANADLEEGVDHNAIAIIKKLHP